MKKFGTFEGVFAPTILTIVGVILYLRLGWVVGEVGLLHALLIILLAHVATITTGLSVSSLTTNTRIGAGGFYSLITKTLGLEAGGAVGIPLYISQALSISLYVVGFTETWLLLFPEHSSFWGMTLVFLIILILSYIGADLALKIQFVVMGIIVISIISYLIGVLGSPVTQPIQIDEKSDFGFWYVFAIFFPAVTGIGAGAAMSGDLKNPKKSMPRGIIGAIAVGLVIYIAMAFLLFYGATQQELKTNQMVMVDKAFIPFFVIAGIMGATFSSALGSFLGAPRILMALGMDRLIPMGKIVSLKAKKGEPRIAILITGLIAYLCMISMDLNAIASLLTMFFLITYASINLAVFIEKAVGTPTFRPSFNIPAWVPLTGGVWCLVIMFLIHPVLAAAASLFILLVYGLQLRRNLHNEWGDVRSGFFTMVAEWAAKTAARLPSGAKNWKPNFLVPIEDPENFQTTISFVRDLVFPKGTLRLFCVQTPERTLEERIQSALSPFFKRKIENKKRSNEDLITHREQALSGLIDPLKKEGIFAAYRVVESNSFLESFSTVTQILQGMFFPPNIVFLTMGQDPKKDKTLANLAGISLRAKLGILIYVKKEVTSSNHKDVNLWLREGSPNIHLSILAAMLLVKNWNGIIRLISVVDTTEKVKKRKKHLNRVVEFGRLPSNTERVVHVGTFSDFFPKAPDAKINLFGAANEVDFKSMHDIVGLSKTPCLFVKGVGKESGLI